jgi:branched-chain amino acid transport system substrate-binding protein
MNLKSVLAFMLVFMLAACATEPATTQNSIKVGGLYALSGDYANILGGAAAGTRMAVEEFKAETGKEVIFIEEDDKSCSDKTTAANKLINLDKVQAILGTTCSSMTLSIAPLAADSKTIVISGVSSSSAVTNAGPHVFRTYASDEAKSKKIADEITAHGYKNVAFLYGNTNDAELTVINDVKKYLGESVNIVADQQGTDKDAEFRTQLLKIKEGKPDVLVVAFSGAPAYGRIMVQKAQLGMADLPIYAGLETVENKEVVELGGKDADGILYPYFAEPAGAEYEQFKARYKQKFSEDPPTYAAESYDAAMITLKAIAQSDGTQDGIMKQMYAVGNNYQGVSGTITFDENGDVQKPIVMKTIKNGEFVKVQP